MVTLITSTHYSKILHQLEKKEKTSVDENFRFLRNIILNRLTIKTNDAAQYFKHKYNNEVDTLTSNKIYKENTSWKFHIIGSTMEKLSIIVFIVIGINMVFYGQLSLEMFLAFYSYSSIFSSSVTKLFKFTTEMQSLIVSSQRVMQLYNTTTIEDLLPNRIDISSLKFEHVSISYTNTIVIEDFSYSFFRDHIYLIVGSNGSGKTTVLNTLAGLIRISDGLLLYGNITQDIMLSTCMNKYVSLYSQDDVVYNISIRDNILLFDEHKTITLNQVENICKELKIWQSIQNLPCGIDTKFSDTFNMSYGQKRKIILARILLKPSQILLLDEPLNGIDRQSQTDVLTAIRKYSLGKIVIIATHKEDQFLFADEVIRLRAKEICK